MTIAADLRRSGRRLVPLASLVLVAVPLYACSSAPMSSFDAEKGRVRGALSQNVTCTERPMGPGTALECKSSGGTLTVNLTHDGSKLALSAQLDRRNGNDAELAYPDFRKVADLYGIEQTEEEKCISEYPYTEQTDTFKVQCYGISDAGFLISIEQYRPI